MTTRTFGLTLFACSSRFVLLVATTCMTLGWAAIAPASVMVTSEFLPGSATDFTAGSNPIPNPSATDLAESATFTFTGTPNGVSGPISVLHDGQLQPANDDPTHSFFEDQASYTISVNLGIPVALSEVNTYSRHNGDGSRAPQNYTLLGSSDDVHFTPIASVANPTGSGGAWGNSITGTLGTYQYLQFNVANIGGTFYGEIDVYGHALPEPSSMVLCGLGAIGLFIAARRRREA